MCGKGPVVCHPEEVECALDAVLTVDGNRDPPRVGDRSMGQRTARHDELVANPAWEGDVGVALAVQVSELTPAESELDATEAVVADLDVRPGSDHGADAGARAGLIECMACSCHHVAPFSY
jgi:hypothetical protein